MSFSVDVHILLYASDADGTYYKQAKSFLDDCMNQEELFCLAWPTVMSYLRIATHPSIFRKPLTPDEAMANIGMLMSLPHVRFLSEEEGFWDIYRKLTTEVPTRGNVVPDTQCCRPSPPARH